jgi:hypothetical protein
MDGKAVRRVLTCATTDICCISQYAGIPVAMGGTAIPLFYLCRSNTIENSDVYRRMSE